MNETPTPETSEEILEAAAREFAAIGVMPKAANELHEPGRVREAFKSGAAFQAAQSKAALEEMEERKERFRHYWSQEKKVSDNYIAKLAATEERLRIATEALEFYDSLQWRPRVIQWWPFTRSDLISKRASEALAKLKESGGKV